MREPVLTSAWSRWSRGCHVAGVSAAALERRERAVCDALQGALETVTAHSQHSATSIGARGVKSLSVSSITAKDSRGHTTLSGLHAAK
jgi:hypothetical protein